jgi:hypothetical protein
VPFQAAQLPGASAGCRHEDHEGAKRRDPLDRL